jgi:hypothetical protein
MKFITMVLFSCTTWLIRCSDDETRLQIQKSQNSVNMLVVKPIVDDEVFRCVQRVQGIVGSLVEVGE